MLKLSDPENLQQSKWRWVPLQSWVSDPQARSLARRCTDPGWRLFRGIDYNQNSPGADANPPIYLAFRPEGASKTSYGIICIETGELQWMPPGHALNTYKRAVELAYLVDWDSPPSDGGDTNVCYDPDTFWEEVLSELTTPTLVDWDALLSTEPSLREWTFSLPVGAQGSWVGDVYMKVHARTRKQAIERINKGLGQVTLGDSLKDATLWDLDRDVKLP